MKISESLIEAASILQPTAEVRVRNVLSVLVGEMPEDAVTAAVTEFWLKFGDFHYDEKSAMRAALAVFLKRVAGEQP